MKTRPSIRLLLTAIIVLCGSIGAAAQAVSSDAAGEETGAYTFRVLTYNVCGLPDLFTYDRNLANMDKRFKYIGEKLKAYDIVGLQEAFVSKRTIIEDKLSNYFLTHGTDTGMSGQFGSGVYTFSKWPILRSYYERWRISEGPDSLSHKGFVLATTHVNEELAIDVYNLHAQAGGKKEIGVDNMHQLVEAMKLMSFGTGKPILLIGDFNCRFWDDRCTTFVEESGVETVFPEQEGVDHIFYHENGSGWKISVESYQAVFTEKLGSKLPSDHQGFEVIFKFEKE